MTAKRYGGFKLVWHHQKLKDLLEKKVSAPIYVRVKPTNKCNHRCYFCSYEPSEGDMTVRDEIFDRSDEIPEEKMIETLIDFMQMGVKAVTYSGGGEPLIYPWIDETMKRTLKYGINLSVITNGQCLHGEKAEILKDANWVRVSSDASDAKSFSEIRRVPQAMFYVLTENIRNFARIKSKECELGINFVVHKKNADQVYRSAKHFKELGANHIKITPMWVSGFREYHAPIKDSVLEQIAEAKKLEDENFAVFDTYKNDFSLSSVSERTCPRCYIMQTVPVIGANSKVYFCHDKAYASSGVLGSIKDKSFGQLWFSKEAAEIFRSFDPRVGCKHHCANDAKNILINNAIACYGEDVNFI
jgi:MoaA/NifB/PqqE/SkfB family radical SAM enzyme